MASSCTHRCASSEGSVAKPNPVVRPFISGVESSARQVYDANCQCHARRIGLARLMVLLRTNRSKVIRPGIHSVFPPIQQPALCSTAPRFSASLRCFRRPSRHQKRSAGKQLAGVRGAIDMCGRRPPTRSDHLRYCHGTTTGRQSPPIPMGDGATETEETALTKRAGGPYCCLGIQG